jgi:hypothetical protein
MTTGAGPYSGGIASWIASPDGMTAQAGRLRAKMAAVGWKEKRVRYSSDRAVRAKVS